MDSAALAVNMYMSKLEVIIADPRSAPIQALLERLDDYQRALYPDASNYLDSATTLAAAYVHFVAAYRDNRVLGCGAVKRMCADDVDVNVEVDVDSGAPQKSAPPYGEIKRMYVQSAARGRGVAQAIMANLEHHARQHKINTMRLETGTLQPAALALYTALGYHRRGPFGAYADDPWSIFMEKTL